MASSGMHNIPTAVILGLLMQKAVAQKDCCQSQHDSGGGRVGRTGRRWGRERVDRGWGQDWHVKLPNFHIN